MLFAGLGSVRIVKNCDRGLENAARGRWPRAAFSSLRYSTEILLNTATIREVNSTEIDSNFTARETQDYAPLQRQATNNQTNSHNLKTLNWIYLVTFLAILKWTEINLRWLIGDGCVKKAKDWRLPLTFRREIYAAGKKSGPWAVSLKAGPVTCVWLANQIRGLRIPARSDAWEKNNLFYWLWSI